MSSTRALLGVTLALLAACKSGGTGAPDAAAPRPTLGAITVHDSSPELSATRLDTTAVAAELRRCVLASGLVAPPATDGGTGTGPTLRLNVELGAELVEIKDKGEARLSLRLQIDSRPSESPGAIADDVMAKAIQGYALRPAPDRPALLRTLALRTVVDLWDGVVARRRLAVAPPSAVHAALTADGGALRGEAIRLVATRRLRDEVPTLLKLLDDSEESIRDAALGALIELRETRAVPVLTKSRPFGDSREMRKILDAVADLGGREALDYLTFVSETHQDGEVRQMATAALARLNRRMDAGR